MDFVCDGSSLFNEILNEFLNIIHKQFLYLRVKSHNTITCLFTKVFQLASFTEYSFIYAIKHETLNQCTENFEFECCGL